MRTSCHLFSDGSQSSEGTIFRAASQETPAARAWLALGVGICLLLPGLLRSQELPAQTAASPASTNSPVRELSPGLFTIGMVRLNQSNHTVSLPATVNLRAGALEYLLVTDYGKIHESLLRTTVTPYHLQLALLLLGLSTSKTNSPQGASHLSGDLTVEIAWTVGRRTRTFPAGRFIQDRRNRKTIGAGKWRFTGSRFREDGFAAQADGSIITLIDDLDAIIGNRLPGSNDDDNWLAVGNKLPSVESPVELILRPSPLPPRPR